MLVTAVDFKTNVLKTVQENVDRMDERGGISRQMWKG